MKVDLHVHSKYSQRPSEWILKKLGCPESFTEPYHIYAIARDRGMSHVTISDHNTIEGALAIAHLPGVFISEEVTTYFPEDGCKVHVLTVNITEAQHREIQKLRENVFDLVAYFHQENILNILAHPLYPVNDRLTVDHVEKMLLLFRNFELNGARNKRENNCIAELANALTPETISRLSEKHTYTPLYSNPEQKRLFSGSDDHSSLNIARSYTEFTAAEIADLKQDRIQLFSTRTHAKNATPKTMAHNIYGIAWQFYRNKFNLRKYAGRDPLIRFLDSFLLSIDDIDHPLISKVLFYFNNRNQKKQTRPISDSLNALLRHEANKLIQENPDLLHVDPLDNTSLQIREEKWYRWVNKLSARLLRHFSDHLMNHVSGANVFSVFHTIGSAGGLFTLLAPYFVAYSQFTSGREIGKTLRQRILKGTANRQNNRTKNSINVAHFTDTFYEINGVAKTLQQQVKLAAQNNKSYTLITCDCESPLNYPGVKHFEPIGTYELPEYPEQKIFYPPLLEMMDYCHQQDFSQIHTATPGPIGLAALAIAKILELPICGTYHTAIPQYVQILTGSRFMEELTWKFILWYYDQLDMIYVPSLSTKTELQDKGIQADKISVYPRGIDINQFHPSKRNGFFKPYFEADEKIKFLYTGRVSREKNLDLLVKAFKRLVQVSDNLYLIVVGEGPYLQGMKSELHGLPCLFTGYLDGEELSAAYASSDVFVFPSTTDTFGNVVLEAQASGLPVIVTDQGGPGENILPDETGILIKGGCNQSLLNAMKIFTDNKPLAAKMGAAARAYAEERSFEKAFLDSWELFREFSQESGSSKNNDFGQDIQNCHFLKQKVQPI